MAEPEAALLPEAPGELRPEAVSDRTVPGIFLRQAARLGRRAMVGHHDGTGWRELSWEAAREAVLRIAAHLTLLEIEAGDRVVLLSENSLGWILCDLAIQSARAVTVPIHPSTTPDIAQSIAADSGAKLAIASGPVLASHLAPGGALERVVTMETDVAAWMAAPGPPETALEVRRRLEELAPEDLATIAYTSGTTGLPKGAMLPQRCFGDMARSSVQAFHIGEEDVSLSMLPFSHILERMDGLVVGIAAGARMNVSRGIDSAAADLQEVRPTIMVGVPRMYEKMYDAVQDGVRQADWVRRTLFRWSVGSGRRFATTARPGPLLRAQHALALRLVLRDLHKRIAGGRLRFFVSGGAPLSREVESFFWAIGVEILQGWGLTETTSGATSNTEEGHRFETVGRPLPGVEVKIAADGEILVRGPGVMTGYHNRPEANRESFQDGWFLTGDIGAIDADGFLTITDRKKDLIKTAGGKYVAPQPLEARLEQDRLVRRVVVVGDRRPHVVALVVPDWEGLAAIGLAGDHEALAADPRVRQLIQTRVDTLNRDLARHETIKGFAILPRDFTEEAGELTPTLKIRRRAVEERYAAEIDALYVAAAAARRARSR